MHKPCTPYQLAFVNSMFLGWIGDHRAVSLQIKEKAIRAAHPTLKQMDSTYIALYYAAVDEIASEQASKLIRRRVNNLRELTCNEASQVINKLKADYYHELRGYRKRRNR